MSVCQMGDVGIDGGDGSTDGGSSADAEDATDALGTSDSGDSGTIPGVSAESEANGCRPERRRKALNSFYWDSCFGLRYMRQNRMVPSVSRL